MSADGPQLAALARFGVRPRRLMPLAGCVVRIDAVMAFTIQDLAAKGYAGESVPMPTAMPEDQLEADESRGQLKGGQDSGWSQVHHGGAVADGRRARHEMKRPTQKM